MFDYVSLWLMDFNFIQLPAELIQKAQKIKFVITDCDGVLTDNGVYFTSEGEYMKRFSIRDGMGVERMRNLYGIHTGIMTGELSGSVKKRAEKLKITHLYLGVKDKKSKLEEVIHEIGVSKDEIAFIGDDTNDLEIMNEVGLAACPGDATPFAKEVADYICNEKGGFGAFRELAELIIYSKNI
jgi:3-deoxy-D-manno-octulosonate 8-phosphate phosphatase (KDO 8-P phosphatase)